ncbi:MULTISPECIES: TetR/AcrR family transcriptional regulator [unclassified Mycolicibacterium]|uniref:TetR/AcrR family transcriptional regulator n=1 Tax=unclassified Mycolicibacterium TaxID=2636767 RepID=UPI0012DF80A9|nr:MULTISPECIES: TetR family transcriptional regulator [unclassified Mycolicibacterium]MUL80779.1 TetR/AcrR family transcriptional regulator [Mycolicibacterium sp. CBMA 329]MUL86546.1 TetR/AcrR family transcriptional regulator [Mycolicibacterium sp. CBMA 331]MUM01407.1 TetR/AcrR family transcriptional regulator [Mycolicibacterium sp. CBMA 334]MUM25916.1 TetR/AcrR family transcriptional regulator [Mycolicibacterium sp. CBMA 295]MUM36842.1 TetR/AcrR family transcriptional regulator [Mycolicibact
MARIGTPREPGQASTPRQLARNAAILRAAGRLGALHGLERVQMSDIAADAGVALGTLYRYYPTKHHLYAAALTASIRAMPEPAGIPDDPVVAVCDFLGEAAERLLAQPPLARAMLVSVNAIRSSADAPADLSTRERILAVAGVAEPTDEDHRLARMVEQCMYGILTWATAGQLDAAAAAADVRYACELLLAPWNERGRR